MPALDTIFSIENEVLKHNYDFLLHSGFGNRNGKTFRFYQYLLIGPITIPVFPLHFRRNAIVNDEGTITN